MLEAWSVFPSFYLHLTRFNITVHFLFTSLRQPNQNIRFFQQSSEVFWVSKPTLPIDTVLDQIGRKREYEGSDGVNSNFVAKPNIENEN